MRSPEQAGGCSLLHLAPPGSGPGWLTGQAAGALGGPGTPCPCFVFGRCALHAGPRLGAPRAPGREAKFSQGCRSISGCVATGPSGQASGHRGPALRSPGRQERAQRGLGRSARRRRGLGPGHAPYLAGAVAEAGPPSASWRPAAILASVVFSLTWVILSVAGLPCCAETRMCP